MKVVPPQQQHYSQQQAYSQAYVTQQQQNSYQGLGIVASDGAHSQKQLTQPHLSPVNQQILERLKQQQAQRVQERRQLEGQSLHQSAHFQTAGADLVPASGQFGRQSQQQLQQQQQLAQSISPSENKKIQGSSSAHKHSQSASSAVDTHAKDHLLVMTIDLGEGNSDILHIFEADDPLVIAEQFCLKNNLTNEAMAILAKNIEANKQIVLQERQHQLYHMTRTTSPPPAKTFTQSNNYYASPQNVLMHSTQQQNQHSSSTNGNTLNNNNNSSSSKDIRNNYYKANQGGDSSQVNQQYQPAEEDEGYYAVAEQEAEEAGQIVHSKNPSQDLERQQVVNHAVVNEEVIVIPQEKQSIFERLYAEAALKEQRRENKKKQESSVLSTSTRSVKKYIGTTELNLGEYLYHKGQMMKNSKQQNAEEYILLQMEKEKLYPFKPEINENSERICMAKRNELGVSTEDYLMQQGMLYKEKKDLKKSTRENEQVENCTFKPQVNPVSEFLVEQKRAKQHNQSGGKFEELHEEARMRNQRKFERGQVTECSFHPKTNDRPAKNNENMPFVERMMKNVNEKEKKQQERVIRQKLEEEEKSESTFTPVVGRAPKERNSEGLPVFEYLYNKKEDKKLKQEYLTQIEEEKIKASMPVALESSAHMVESILRQRLEELFNMLDNDGDGKISQNNIDITHLSNEMIEFIAPLLFGLEESGQSITFENFYEDMIQRMKYLNIAQKNEMFNSQKNKWDEKRSKVQQFEYKPVINERSQRLASKRSPEKFKRLYENGLENKKVKEFRMNTFKEQQIKKEMEECSFKPELYRPMNIYGFTDPKISQQNSHFFGGQNAFDLGDGQFRVTGVVHNAPTTNSIQQ